MTCRISETTLALHVEGDLPDHEARPLGPHIDGCERCRGLVSDLTASQRRLKSLRDAPLDAAMVERLHGAVMEAVSGKQPRSAGVTGWRGALAASVAALLVAGALLWWTTPRPPASPSRAARVSTPVPSPTPPPLSREAPSRETLPRAAVSRETSPRKPAFRSHQPGSSTLAPSEPVSESVDTAVAAHRLTPEDADRLAQALLAVSKIDTLPRPPEDDAAEGPRDGTLVRWTTADPDIVVYWQFDSNGG